ncbi:hypothetical protein D3C77_758540 [compost metagenome]
MLNDLPVMHNINLIAVHDGTDSMRNEQSRFALCHELFDAFYDALLHDGVHCSRRLIQY